MAHTGPRAALPFCRAAVGGFLCPSARKRGNAALPTPPACPSPSAEGALVVQPSSSLPFLCWRILGLTFSCQNQVLQPGGKLCSQGDFFPHGPVLLLSECRWKRKGTYVLCVMARKGAGKGKACTHRDFLAWVCSMFPCSSVLRLWPCLD